MVLDDDGWARGIVTPDLREIDLLSRTNSTTRKIGWLFGGEEETKQASLWPVVLGRDITLVPCTDISGSHSELWGCRYSCRDWIPGLYKILNTTHHTDQDRA
ncbi:hypothetical protein CBL_00212 [Carabus blaptoides fortunei]